MYLLIPLVLIFGILHLPFFRKKKLWDTVGERAAWAMALSFLLTGGLHFVRPETFLALMPDFIPAQKEMIYAAGGAQLLGGLGLINKKIRRPASFGLIALLLAVLPANLKLALEGSSLPGFAGSEAAGWASLPMQAFYMFWAWKVGRTGKR